MSKKKVVFVLVEGPSDETALAPFSKHYTIQMRFMSMSKEVTLHLKQA